jgi:hypothetical protein
MPHEDVRRSMPIYLTQHRLDLLDRILSDSGLDRRDFAWWRVDGSRAGYKWEYESGSWGALPIESNRLRHVDGPFEFAIVGAIGRDTFSDSVARVRFGDGKPVPESADGLFHVWGYADRWLVPGDPTVPVAFPELLQRFRDWVGQVTAHLGVVPQRDPQHGLQVVIQNSTIGALVTGAGGSAVLLHRVDPETARLVSLELKQFSAELERFADVDPAQVSLMREAIASAMAEASKARPNPLSLGGTVAAIAAASQGLAAWPQAYGVIKAIAAMMGIRLP